MNNKKKISDGDDKSCDQSDRTSDRNEGKSGGKKSAPLKIIREFHSEEESLAWGRRLGAKLKSGDCLLLEGTLGAGKSLLCRGIAEGLGFRGNTSSPTYAIVNEYDHTPPIFHIDLYRLPIGADWEEIGLEHYLFSEGITLIEWAERLEGFDLKITGTLHLEITGEYSRKITLTPTTAESGRFQKL